MSAPQVTIPDRAIALLVVTDILALIAIIIVALRLVARLYILHSAGLDDVFIFLALITTVGMIITIDIGIKYGTGEHEQDVDVNKVILGKIRLSTQVLYIVASGIIKIAILFLYLRLFPTLRIWILVTVGLIVAMTIAFTFVAIFQCDAVGTFWITNDEGRFDCVSTMALWCDVAATFLATNIWITVLPLHTLINLHLPWPRKILVILFLCSTGFITCVAATVRLVYVIILYGGHDPSYDSVPIYYCSTVEMTVALVACSIPPLRPAFSTSMEKLQTWRKKSSLSGSSECTV